MMFARLDFPRFLVCCSGDLSDNESEENPSVAMCGGSICILTGLHIRSFPTLVKSELYVSIGSEGQCPTYSHP